VIYGLGFCCARIAKPEKLVSLFFLCQLPVIYEQVLLKDPRSITFLLAGYFLIDRLLFFGIGRIMVRLIGQGSSPAFSCFKPACAGYGKDPAKFIFN
jgi:hypothetical protein